MPRYIKVEDITLKGVAVFDENLDVLIPLSDVRNALLMAPTADVVPRAELDAMRGAANSYKMHYENLAREIFEEILEGLQHEIDMEDKYGRNAWAQGDVSGFQTHDYTEDKLETLQVALSLLKKKYTKGE